MLRHAAAETGRRRKTYVAHFQIARMTREGCVRSAGNLSATIRSPGSNTVSRSGASPEAAKIFQPHLAPAGLPSISTTASSATSGTQKSDGMGRDSSHRSSRGPACRRLSPWRRRSPNRAPACCSGGHVIKVAQRVRCRRLRRRRGITQLRGCARQQRFGHGRIGLAKLRHARDRHSRTSAPMRRPPPARGSMRSSPGSLVTSTRRSGRLHAAFMRSTRLVPAAR